MRHEGHPIRDSWKEAVAKYRNPVLRRSIGQLVTSIVPYLALWALMIWSLSISYWITLAIAVVAAGFLVRIFIIFHDCGHGSFFRSRKANRLFEFLTGVMTFTPYRHWRHMHAQHHATSGDLDRRGPGEIWTLTVREYLEASRWRRFAYRFVRNPLVLFGLAPFFLFLVQHRFSSKRAGDRERRGVHWTNAALLLIVTLMSVTIGIEAYVLIQLPVIVLAATAGIWLFYVQHQFEGVQWARRSNWVYAEAALRGSSFYKLPKLLQWFTGNIGFHHIHHLSPAIPNYNLERCHRETPLFQQVEPVTLWASMKSLSFRLWDEQRMRLVGFRRIRQLRRTGRSSQSDTDVRGSDVLLSLALLLVIAPSDTIAQSKSTETPVNSHVSRYGDGWECDRGFRRVGESCLEVKVPENARLNVSGDRWECSRGFRRNDDSCSVVDVPPNGFLNSRGNAWECDRGYTQVDQSCVAIKLPANAYLIDSYGRGWECDRGFRRFNDACDPVDVPPNGFLRSDGRGWDCDRGFSKVDRSCAAVDVPVNGFLDSSGHRWECNRGFQRAGTSCEAFSIPPEAYLSSSGRGWDCRRGFRKRDNKCNPVNVPANAYLDYSGRGWNCDWHFKRSGDSCISLELPSNAHIDSSGNDWTCNAGYRRTRETCTRIEG